MDSMKKLRFIFLVATCGIYAARCVNVGYQDVGFSYDLEGKEVCQNVDCAQILNCEYRQDGGVSTPSLTREISMRIFYPTEQVESGIDDSKDRDVCQVTDLGDINIFAILSGDTSAATLEGYCVLDAIRVTATLDAEPAPGSYPILLFSSGLGAFPHMYTTLLQALVKRGFIVVALSHSCIDAITIVNEKIFLAELRMGLTETTEAASFGSILEMEDARAGLDKLELVNSNPSSILFGKLDMESHNGVGYFGHSLGGAASILAAAEEAKNGDNRIRACLDMDGGFAHGGRNFLTELAETKTPFMLMSGPLSFPLFFSNGWQAWSSLAPQEAWLLA